MKMNIIKYLVLLLFGMYLIGCSEDFLNPVPPAVLNEGSFYRTMDQADQALTACYAQFNAVGAWDKDLIMTLSDITSDDEEAGGDFVNEVPGAENINRLTTEKTDGSLDNVYGTLFRAIALCNAAITRLPGVADADPEADIDLLNKRIGEAKFLRAINYLYLTFVFGEVPLVDHTVGSSEYELGRANLKDIYDLIEQDLKDAIAVLPERGGWGSEHARATKGAAQALLARMCLFESSYHQYCTDDARFDRMTERWADALSYAEAVITSGKYELVGINGETYNTWRGAETNGFRYVFTSDGDFCPEGIFEISCIQEWLPYIDARGNSLAHWTTARYYYDENYVSTYNQRWGLGLPTRSLLAEFEDGDPRLETTIAYEYRFDSVNVGGIWYPKNDTLQIGNARWVPISFTNSVSKTYQRKWECSSAEYWDNYKDWCCAPNNVRLIRYAEVYLIAAEAALALGQTDKALGYLNKVRERARMCGTTGAPAPLTSVTFDDIVHERRVELACEGLRMFDLVRWNLAYELLNNKPNDDGYVKIFNKGQNEFQPLPEREITLSGGKMRQYPGWE
ncbi:MAG: RagB/SusD family nutrient uptake outer membrane protein [Bacteroidales bacterium]|nr:RagB/SusD family nutrient uptake outer membrane protein [Bacteroidales bacterium]MBN2763952.1 RagB/SusD family nutrient uptake outer membrane protein [Bacteroidales bacterium]